MSCTDIEDILPHKNNIDPIKLKNFVEELLQLAEQKSSWKFWVKKEEKNNKTFMKYTNILRRKYKCMPSKINMMKTYYKYFSHIPISENLSRWLIKTSTRSQSGVLVVTVTLAPSWGETSGRKKGCFSCSKDCYLFIMTFYFEIYLNYFRSSYPFGLHRFYFFRPMI